MKTKVISIVAACMLPLFSAAQLHFYNVTSNQSINHTYGDGEFGGGASFKDFNGDGWDDLSLGTEDGQPIQFYDNLNGQFQLITPSLVNDSGEVKQILWADIDNDSDQDLFLSFYRKGVKLYENTGGLNLMDITTTSGLEQQDTVKVFGAAFGDYDNDGLLDLYLTKRCELPYSADTAECILYRNLGNSQFQDVTVATMSSALGAYPFNAGFIDHNDDGLQDIYVINDRPFFPNILLQNQGNSTFMEVGAATNADVAIDAMSVTVGDPNRDGFQDIYVTNTWAEDNHYNSVFGSAYGGNKYLQNDGTGSFTEMAAQIGIHYGDIGWGSIWMDFDNDGDEDLYVAGTCYFCPLWGIEMKNYMYENDGMMNFSEEGGIMYGDSTATYATIMGDFDQNGYVDIFNCNETPHNSGLYQNTGGNGNWLTVGLEGTISNRDGIGSKIEAYYGGEYQMQYRMCGEGYLAQHSSDEFFGLGTNTLIDSLVVTWLSGVQDRLYGIPANQKIHVLENSTGIPTALYNSSSIAVSVYPTVASNRVYLEFNEKQSGQAIDVLDALGRTVGRHQLNSGAKRVILDVSNFDVGTYYLLDATSGAALGRFFKARDL